VRRLSITCRARDDAQKLARRQELLDAGWALFRDDGEQLPSVSQITRKAGLAKGTFYLYFKTKEELYIELFKEAFERVFFSLQRDLDDEAIELEILIDHFVHYVCKDEALIRLGAVFNGVLENHAEEEVLLRFKMRMVKLVMDTATLVSRLIERKNHSTRCYRPLPPDLAARLLLRSYAAYLGVLQMQPTSRQVCEMMQMPMFDPLCLNLQEDTKAIIRALWMEALILPG
jgi:AcrR family transcriptional regulator